MNKVIHFEIRANNPERAARFYEEAFGWIIHESVIPGVLLEDKNRYWLITTGPDTEPGINGGMSWRQGQAPTEGQPINSYVCTLGVSNLNESVEKVLIAGGSIVIPKMAVIGVGLLAYAADTEGNIFGMMQEDEDLQ